MISPEANSSCFPNVSQGLKMYPVTDSFVSSSVEASGGPETHSNSLLYTLSLLKEKVHQVQGLVGILVSQDHHNHQQQPESTSIAMANMGSLVQEIIMNASTILFSFQQMTHVATTTHVSGNNSNSNEILVHQPHVQVAEIDGLATSDHHQPHFDGNNIGQDHQRAQGFYSGTETFENCWYGDQNIYYNCNTTTTSNGIRVDHQRSTSELSPRINVEIINGGNSSEKGAIINSSKINNDMIIELDAANLLAKYTHYCQICGKGFKRDANLRMHMRAHGDEYKTSAALLNPLKKIIIDNNNGNTTGNNDKDQSAMICPRRKYSCPQEGCRWNQKHAKFQPLKSMICVKNHYKRSHCPKMYVCKRCNRKQFSVLSDLRTHEKHCGDLKWQCSCGTTFSRKDKLMGHVALFIGHTAVINNSTKPAKMEINQSN
ncbi:hypothetical protein ACOSP7_016286 [Xanthoceras sorbifolium]